MFQRAPSVNECDIMIEEGVSVPTGGLIETTSCTTTGQNHPEEAVGEAARKSTETRMNLRTQKQAPNEKDGQELLQTPGPTMKFQVADVPNDLRSPNNPTMRGTAMKLQVA